MFYAFIGFLIGSLIPYMSRRFAKFMPATPAYALYRLLWPTKKTVKKNDKFGKLLKEYRIRSFIFAVISGFLSYFAAMKFGDVGIWFVLSFLWILLLLSEIDIKMQLLPDLLTFPLLVFGFLYAATINQYLTPFDSAFGALFGYVMPVVASVLMLGYSKDAFGGGDIKLMTAIGAWLGVQGLLYTTLIACALFLGFALLKKIRAGAFGPALAIAAIIVLFMI